MNMVYFTEVMIPAHRTGAIVTLSQEITKTIKNINHFCENSNGAASKLHNKLIHQTGSNLMSSVN